MKRVDAENWSIAVRLGKLADNQEFLDRGIDVNTLVEDSQGEPVPALVTAAIANQFEAAKLLLDRVVPAISAVQMEHEVDGKLTINVLSIPDTREKAGKG